MSSETIKSFLVSIGYTHDSTSLKQVTEGIENVTKSVIKLGAIIEATALTVAVGVAKFAGNLEELYFSSARTGATATNIKALDRAARDFGAGAGEAQASLEGLARFLRTNPGGEQTIANWFGISTRDKNGKMLGPDEMMLAIAKSLQKMPAWQALQRGEAAGLSENVILAMMNPKFGANFDTISARLKNAGFEQAAIHAHQFMEELRTLEDELVIFGARVEDALQQKLGWSLKSVVDWFHENQPWLIDQTISIAEWFVSSFDKILAWTKANWPIIRALITQAFFEINWAWAMYVEPALSWIYTKLVDLNAATDGWSTRLIAIAALLSATGTTGLVTGVLGLAAALVKVEAALLGISGTAIMGTLAKIGGALFGIGQFLNAISLGIAAGYGLDKLFPKVADWFGEHVGGALYDSVQFANKSMQASKPENWAMGYLMQSGLSKEHAAGIVANLSAESGMNEKAVNGSHYGLAQWDTNRQADFAKWAGFDIHDDRATFAKQLDFIMQEMFSGDERNTGRLFLASQNAEQAGQIMSHYYERHGSLEEDAKRRAIAANLSQQTTINVYGSDPGTTARHVAGEQERITRTASAALVREFSSVLQ